MRVVKGTDLQILCYLTFYLIQTNRTLFKNWNKTNYFLHGPDDEIKAIVTLLQKKVNGCTAYCTSSSSIAKYRLLLAGMLPLTVLP